MSKYTRRGRAALQAQPAPLPVLQRFELPESADPRGVCCTCRFFVQDPDELAQEFAFILRQKPVIVVSERVKVGEFTTHKEDGSTETAPVYANKAVRRVARHVNDLALAIYQQLGEKARPGDLGLCEKGGVTGNARFVVRSGVLPERCPKWREGKAERPENWRELRERYLHGENPEVQGSDPCPCGSGKTYGACCGPGGNTRGAA